MTVYDAKDGYAYVVWQGVRNNAYAGIRYVRVDRLVAFSQSGCTVVSGINVS